MCDCNQEYQIETLKYYTANAKAFTESTKCVDFHEMQNHFLSYLPKGALILDFGCGSGRDAKAFLEYGYQVTAVDGNEELCKAAEKFIGQPVIHMFFQELKEQNRYDGIWACSSILHLKRQDLSDVFHRITAALKEGGYFYTSFKYGNFEGIRNGRYFTDMTETSFEAFLTDQSDLELVTYYITSDARKGREEEKWLNVILRKRTM